MQGEQNHYLNKFTMSYNIKSVRKHYHINGSRRRIRIFPVLASSLALVLTIGGYLAFRPQAKSNTDQILSVVKPAEVEASEPTGPIDFPAPIPWPRYGNASFAVPKDQISVVAKKSDQAVPIASLAKIITVLAIMEKKPLNIGEEGPMIPISQADVAIYEEYVRKSGTVLPIQVGVGLSQHQALEAIMMVSANNISDTAAIWAFGSMDAYVTYANSMLANYGLKNTTVTDASGYSPQTVSTPEDMAQLGAAYMKNPVLRQISLQQQVSLPFAGQIRNNNSFANGNGIIGVKIGNTDEAGKCYLAADIRQTADGEELSVVVVLGAKDFQIAAKDARSILEAGNKGHDTLLNKIP